MVLLDNGQLGKKPHSGRGKFIVNLRHPNRDTSAFLELRDAAGRLLIPDSERVPREREKGPE